MEIIAVNPLICPLCQQQNFCENLVEKGSGKTCWCNNPEIKFPKALLDQVPEDRKGKACICQQCAQAFSNEKSVEDMGVKKYKPE